MNDKKTCFVIMPFSKTTEKHNEKYWDSLFSEFIKPPVENLGYNCIRSHAHPSNIMKEILDNIYKADLILAVLTDENPNVFYELGISHTLPKKTIMLLEEGHKIPFDIRSYGVVYYKDDYSDVNVKDFEKKLRDFITKINDPKTVSNPVAEFVKPKSTVLDDIKSSWEFEEEHNKHIGRELKEMSTWPKNRKQHKTKR